MNNELLWDIAMTTASIATSLVACFIQLICLMSRPLRTMLRVTKHFKKKCVLLFGMNRLKHRKKNNKCENFLLVWEFSGERGEVWEFKKKMFVFQTGVEIPTPRASLVYTHTMVRARSRAYILTSICCIYPHDFPIKTLMARDFPGSHVWLPVLPLITIIDH